MKKLNIVELFSGIGSQARALNNIKIKTRVAKTCEWDIHAFVAYDTIHNSSTILEKIEAMNKEQIINYLSKYTLSNDGKESLNLKTLNSYDLHLLKRIASAIKKTNNMVDISMVLGKSMPKNIDLLTYSFPCQDLSNVGAFHGYTKGIDPESGSRSSLLWQVGRILSEMKNSGKNLPRYLVMENVPTLLSKKHKPNFDKWKQVLEELGYISKEVKLNAKDFGIPQNRPRLLMISIYVGTDERKKGIFLDYFKKLDSNKIIDDYTKSKYYNKITINDLLRLPKNEKDILWNEALLCTPNDTISRKKIWDNNPKIIDQNGKITKESFIRTITTKQDRNPNSGNIYFDTKITGKSKFRYLTPRECLLFMGFLDKDYESLDNNNPYQGKNRRFFTRDKIIRMAGNSIPVKLLEGFFYQLYEIESLQK